MKIIKILCLLLVSINLLAQDYFIKKIGFDEGPNSGRIIIKHNERLFILASHFCDGLVCSSISEISIAGNTLWVTRVADVDVARVSMIIYRDTITVAGNINNPPLNTKFRMAHFNLEGEKFGQTIEIDHPVEKFTRMFQQIL